MTATVFQPLTLASGATLGNRIVKAAMEENMAMAGQLPGKSLFELYSQWARGGAGLLITGNVMVDRLAMTGPGGVALEADTPLTPFREWAEVVHRAGSQIWMQINHPGRQVFRRMGAGRAPARRLSAILSILMDQVRLSGLTRSYRRHLKLD